MSTRFGMNTSVARDAMNSISGLSGGLAHLEAEIGLAESMSLNPLNFALNPGALILAPTSIAIAESAKNDLANVQQTLQYLMLRLSQEIAQQEQVSNSLFTTDPGWFAAAPTAKRPDEIEMKDTAYAIFIKITNYVLLAQDAIRTAFEAAEKWWKHAPAWVKVGADIGKRAGKFIPFAGLAFSTAAIFTDWDDDYVWGNTRNIVAASLDALTIISLIPPLTVATPVIEVISLAWDAMDTIWDLGDENNWW